MQPALNGTALYNRAQRGFGLTQAVLLLGNDLLKQDHAPKDKEIEAATMQMMNAALILKQLYSRRVRALKPVSMGE